MAFGSDTVRNWITLGTLVLSLVNLYCWRENNKKVSSLEYAKEADARFPSISFVEAPALQGLTIDSGFRHAADPSAVQTLKGELRCTALVRNNSGSPIHLLATVALTQAGAESMRNALASGFPAALRPSLHSLRTPAAPYWEIQPGDTARVSYVTEVAFQSGAMIRPLQRVEGGDAYSRRSRDRRVSP